MTLLQDQLAGVVNVSPAERAQRLTEAGSTWNERIAADEANSQLTYRVSGRGIGSVATEIRAGKHRFLVDEPGGTRRRRRRRQSGRVRAGGAHLVPGRRLSALRAGSRTHDRRDRDHRGG